VHEEVIHLRQLRRERQRAKDAALKENDRLTQELNAVFRNRERLEEQAREISTKLDQASTERLKAQNSVKQSADLFEQMSQDLMLLKVGDRQGQKDTLNRVVAFGD
jgi:hypothetical protein